MKLLSTITSLFVDGISYGMVLFLISVGLTVTLGVMRVANLAHCGFAMIGGYAAYALMGSLGLTFVAALPVATNLSPRPRARVNDPIAAKSLFLRCVKIAS